MINQIERRRLQQQAATIAIHLNQIEEADSCLLRQVIATYLASYGLKKAEAVFDSCRPNLKLLDIAEVAPYLQVR